MAIPQREWRDLLAAMERDHGLLPTDIQQDIAPRVVAAPAGATARLVFAAENIRRLTEVLGLSENQPLLSPRLDGSEACDEARAAAKKMLGTPTPEEPSLVDFLGEFLRFYGPCAPSEIAGRLGLNRDDVEEAARLLFEDQMVVVDEITENAVGLEVCDAKNLARLLRMLRTRARPQFEPLPLENLNLFLATHQGLGRQGSQKGLQDALEQLFGYPAPIGLFEQDLLPARLKPYRASWLDALMAESSLTWVGCSHQKMLFTLETVRDLFPVGEINARDQELMDCSFPEGPGRFSLLDLQEHRKGADLKELTGDLWHLAWRGLVSNDSFAAVRKAVATGFSPEPEPTPSRGPRRPGRAGFSRWKSNRSFPGSWFRLPMIEETGDPLDREEENQERVRLLLDRYGILFRELLAKRNTRPQVEAPVSNPQNHGAGRGGGDRLFL